MRVFFLSPVHSQETLVSCIQLPQILQRKHLCFFLSVLYLPFPLKFTTPFVQGLVMAIMVAMSDPALFQQPTVNIISRKQLFLHEATGGGGRINAWVDSMRASSPPRRSSETDEHKSWMVKHPSALGMFEEIVCASKGKKIVMFLDYDGTLSPIVEDPERAFMSNEMREAVKKVAKYFPTAIVTGRCRAKVYDFVKLPELYYAGSHGMDIKGPAKGHKHKKVNQTVICRPAKDYLPMINEVYKILVEKTKSIPGAKVENNKFCLSVHFRCVEEKRWSEVAEQVKDVLKDYQRLKLTHGRKVLEIRPTLKWDKGKALEFLLESLGYANSDDVLPVYIGDDRTDEDAFKVLRDRRQGLGILVTKVPKETNASYSLQEPLEVEKFLNRLVEWRSLSRVERV